MWRNSPISAQVVLYLVIGLVLALFLPSAAMAHKPILVDRTINSFESALEVPNATVSYAMYGNLKDAHQVDLYKFTIDRETPFHARIAVPKRPGNADFQPAFVVLGPGLPTTNTPPNFPIKLTADNGRAILLSSGEADEFFEPFTQTTLIQRQLFSHKLQPGTYFIAVYDPTGRTGKYVLSTGDREQFGLLDWLSLPVIWFKVRTWYDATQTYLILAGIAAALVGGLIYFRRKKSPS
ncbi:MAG: LPXTG cell wall anchor domain-containing protein [Tumebacillaceae bacterium]